MIPDNIDQQNIPLSALFRFAGQPVNFKILRELNRKPQSPTTLSNGFHEPRNSISTRLSKLKKLGFVDYDRRGRNHVYSIRSPLPTIQHELILELIEIDHTDPERSLDELSHSEELSEETLNEIQEIQKERFQTKLALMASYLGHPGLVSVGQEQEILKSKIEQLDNELDRLKHSNRR